MGRRPIPMAALGQRCAIFRGWPELESCLRVVVRVGRWALRPTSAMSRFQTETLPRFGSSGSDHDIIPREARRADVPRASMSKKPRPHFRAGVSPEADLDVV